MADLVQSIEKVFQGRAFRIPSYQRGYAWREKQWNDLWEDLELLPQKRIHFTGTLVLKNSDGGVVEFTSDEGRHYQVYDVIDGQQRLTTVILLLKAIFEQMDQLDPHKKLANGLRENYLYNLDENGHTFTLLSTHPDAQDYFQTLLMGQKDVFGASNRTEKLLSEGKAYFAARLQEKKQSLDGDFPDYLKKLYTKVTGQLSLIVYEVENDLDAGVIFETMNDRGKPLTELDKVKNYLLYVCSKLDIVDGARMDLAGKINRAWTRIFEELTSAGLSDDNNENQLLRNHWLMAYDYNANNWAQSRTIKETFSLRGYEGRHALLALKFVQYVDTLHMAVGAYCDLIRPTRTNAFRDIQDAKIQIDICVANEKFSRLGSRAGFQPILIAVRLCATDNGEGYLKIVELCERFDFRVYEWLHYQPRAAQSILFRLGNEYYKTHNLDALSVGIRQTLWDYCPDANFNQRFSNETENWYKWGGIKYFLYEYELYLAAKAGKVVQMHWDVLLQSRKEDTIEHILPQTPTDVYWTSRFPTKEERERWTHDIGNLTLTYDNSPLSNKPFRKGVEDHDDKVSYYEDSNLFVERCLKDEKEWSSTEIIKRRESIQQWALERWKIDPPPVRAAAILPAGNVNQMSSQERKQFYLQHFINEADRLGNGAEFRDLLEEAGKFPLYLYLNPKYFGPSFSLPERRKTWMVWIQPDLNIAINRAEFDRHFQWAEGTCASIVGEERQRITRADVPELIDCLHQLLQKIQPETNEGTD